MSFFGRTLAALVCAASLASCTYDEGKVDYAVLGDADRLLNTFKCGITRLGRTVLHKADSLDREYYDGGLRQMGGIVYDSGKSIVTASGETDLDDAIDRVEQATETLMESPLISTMARGTEQFIGPWLDGSSRHAAELGRIITEMTEAAN